MLPKEENTSTFKGYDHDLFPFVLEIIFNIEAKFTLKYFLNGALFVEGSCTAGLSS